MTERPDDPERHLAHRLREYEEGLPASEPPSVATARGPRRGRVVLAAGGVAAVVAVALLGYTIATLPDRGVGQSSPTPTASPTPEPPPSATTDPITTVPTTEPSTETASPSAGATPRESGPITRWAPTAMFETDGWAEMVTDVTYAAGQFVAIGYAQPLEALGQVGNYPVEARIWLSADGREWEQLDPGPSFDWAHPRDIVVLGDGSAVVYGAISPQNAPSEQGAWRTTDGRTWTPIELSLPEDVAYLGKVTGGPRGLVTVAGIPVEEGAPVVEEIWHSVDGAHWQSVYRLEPPDGFEPSPIDWEAGPEGFVVIGNWYRFVEPNGDREDVPFVLASGDGRNWFSGDFDVADAWHVAPVGGDWIVVANETADFDYTNRAPTAFSANGLTWERRGVIEVSVPSPPPEAGVLAGGVISEVASTGERVIASATVAYCCHGPPWAAGIWSSLDGRTWERLGFPDGTAVIGAIEHDGVIVLAGIDRAQPTDDFRLRAAFWIGERD